MATRFSQRQYCTGSGLLKPICSLIISTTSCGASGGSMALMGSPGARCSRLKTISVTPSSVGMPRSKRRTM